MITNPINTSKPLNLLLVVIGSNKLIQKVVVAYPIKLTEAFDSLAEAKNKIQWAVNINPVPDIFKMALVPMLNPKPR